MSSVKFNLDNGIEVRDRVSGLKGIIVARCEYVNGCLCYNVQPKTDPKTPHLISDSWWIDEAQLEKVGQGLNSKPIKKKLTGGPTQKATRY